jgi:hypothetical protein
MKFLGVPWGLRPRRTEQKLALPLLSMLPSAHVYRVGVRVVCFRGSMATPPILYLRFAGSLAVAAQDSRPSGSLLLSCKALSSSTSCRFIPAHKHPHYAHSPGLLEDYRFLTPWMRIKNPVSKGLSRDRFWAGYLTPLPSNVNANLSVGSIPTFLIRSDSFGRHQSWERAPDFPQKTSTVSR